MKKSLISTLILSTATLTMTGCATIFTDAKDQEITIDSHQTGLVLFDYEKEYLCNIPCTLKPTNSGIYIVGGEGYKEKVIMIDRKRNAATYGQLTLGIGEVVDGLSGSDRIYNPHTMVELERINETN